MALGRLIVFEGPDGVGKTTLAHALTTSLQKSNSKCFYYAFPGRANGTLGQLVYRLHHQATEFGIDEISPASLQALHIAAHLDAIDRTILPALDAGTDIILDRFWWSTWVYGMADGLEQRMLNALIAAETIHWRGQIPQASFLISRAEPLNREVDPEAWANLCRLYERVADKQSDLYPVHRITNDRTLADALVTIEEYLTAGRRNI